MLPAADSRASVIMAAEERGNRSSVLGAPAGMTAGAEWWRIWLPSWPLAIAVAALARALGSSTALLNDPDTYLHVTAGHWMLAHHALPSADPFSFSMAGARWVPSEWLGEIVYALAYDAGGWGGVIVLTAVGFAASLGLLTYFLLRRLPPLPALIAALAGGTLVLPHLLARPHVLALPLLVLWCGALLAARDEDRTPPWRLLSVMLLWANIHGSFMFGLALAGFLATEAVLWPAPRLSRLDEARRWGGFVIAVIAVAAVTPNGVAGLLQPLRLVGMPALQAGFIEWRPANLGDFPALELWLLGLLALGLAGGVRLRASRLVLLLGLIHMALAHVRHADLLGLVAPLAVGGAIGRASFVAALGRSTSAVARGAALFARPASPPAWALGLAFAVTISLPVVAHPPLRDGDTTTPAAALAAAARLGLDGPVFNSEGFGGYLVFSGVLVFIDGRIEMYGNDFLARYLAAERGDEAALAAILGPYHIGWTLLAQGTPVVAVLDHMPGWRRAYGDDRAVIHVRVPGG
jgi:hypothetical protein